MKLSIVIVTRNSMVTVEVCLKSIPDNPPEFPIEAFVVDNASTDGTVEIVKKFPKVKLIQNRRNLGFAAANNQAIRKARGSYTLLLNPDTEIRPGAIAKMIDFMGKNPEVGVLGPTVKVIGDGQEVSFTGGGRVRPLLATAGYLRFEKPPEEPMEVDYVTGAVLLIRREVIEKIGLMPEEYFLYYEDTDWCLRARKAGYKVVYYPEAEVLHREGSSFKGRSFEQIYYGAKSGLLFGRRWTPSYLKPIFWLIVGLKFLKRLLIDGPSSPQFLATLDFLRGVPAGTPLRGRLGKRY